MNLVPNRLVCSFVLQIVASAGAWRQTSLEDRYRDRRALIRNTCLRFAPIS